MSSSFSYEKHAEEMSAAEKKIYQFIRDNSEKASGMTANEIAGSLWSKRTNGCSFFKKDGLQ